MTKPRKIMMRPEWHTPISTLREIYEKLDPKHQKRFARRLRELERLHAKMEITKPSAAPITKEGHDETNA